jgi:hypothetical protein
MKPRLGAAFFSISNLNLLEVGIDVLCDVVAQHVYTTTRSIVLLLLENDRVLQYTAYSTTVDDESLQHC